MKVYICSADEAHRRATYYEQHRLIASVPVWFYDTRRDGDLVVEDGSVRVYVDGYIIPFFAVDAVHEG